MPRDYDHDLDRCAVCQSPIHSSQTLGGVCFPCLAAGERARHAYALRQLRNSEAVAFVVIGGAA